MLYFIKLSNVDLTKLLTHLRDTLTTMTLIKTTKLPEVTFRKLPDNELDAHICYTNIHTV
jgi:hypothetical protein